MMGVRRDIRVTGSPVPIELCCIRADYLIEGHVVYIKPFIFGTDGQSILLPSGLSF